MFRELKNSLGANAILKRFDRLILQEYALSDTALSLFRIFFCLFLLFVDQGGDRTFAGGLPAYFYEPPLFSPVTVLSAFPSRAFMIGLNVTITALLVTTLFGYRTKLTSILLTCFLLLSLNFRFSLGKIDHSMAVVVWVPLLLGLAGWGSAFSLDRKFRGHVIRHGNYLRGFYIFLLFSILVFAMLSAGLPKLSSGWLNTGTQAVKGHFVWNYYAYGRDEMLAPLFASLHSDFVWEFFDWATVLFEVGFLIALLKRNIMKYYVLVAMLFHLGNVLILNISFLPNFMVYLLLFPFSYVVKNNQGLRENLDKFIRVKVLILSIAILCTLEAFQVPFSFSGIKKSLQGTNKIYELVFMVLFTGAYIYYQLFPSNKQKTP